MSKTTENLHKDITLLLKDWKEVCKDHQLVTKPSFLKKMRGHILLLNTHSSSYKKNKKIYHLLKHILHTPMGAPIVLEQSLYECAKTYTSNKSKETSLQEYLSKSLSSSKEKDNFLFISLSILDEELLKAG